MPAPRPLKRSDRIAFGLLSVPFVVADIWSRAKRSQVMARIRAKDTGPERLLRRALRHAGIRYRSYPLLPGRPDIAIPAARLAILVHGDFWHGCRRHYRPPSTRRDFWAAKLRSNRARDRLVLRRLRVLGWRPLVVWECELERDPLAVIQRIRRMHPPVGTRAPSQSHRQQLGQATVVLRSRSERTGPRIHRERSSHRGRTEVGPLHGT
jgi:DNA mismatch endonuclease (patch repair protein)